MTNARRLLCVLIVEQLMVQMGEGGGGGGDEKGREGRRKSRELRRGKKSDEAKRD